MAWRYTLPIRDYIRQEDCTTEQSQEAAQKIVTELQRLVKRHPDLDRMDTSELVMMFECAGDQDDVNEALKELWDWCNYHRVWVPPRFELMAF